MSKLRFLLLASALALATAASSPSIAQARHRCVCGDVYYLVQCSDGNTYTNLCLAACAGATDCVPVDPEE